jgi:hypothetical protein
MANQPNDEKSPEQEPGSRIHESSFGKVLARIYRNVSVKDGVYYRVKFFRKESNGEKEWLAKSFFHEDMVSVAKTATASYIWLVDNTDYVPTSALSVVAKFGRVDESGEKSPVHEVQVGNVLASVWENTSRAGNLYHKVSFRRGEILGSEERFWNNFRPEDLSHVAQAATSCRIWFGEMRGGFQRNDVKEEGEKNRPAKRKPRRAAK